MTYFADLSAYSYASSDRPMLNIGWLAQWQPFPRASEVDQRLSEALKTCLQLETQIMRGYHECVFCDLGSPITVASKAQSRVLGHGEIHIQSIGGSVFAAPTLIVHYVEIHRYDPPREFADAAIWLASRLDMRIGSLPDAATRGAERLASLARRSVRTESSATPTPGQDAGLEVLRFDEHRKTLMVTAGSVWAWTSSGGDGAVCVNGLQPPDGNGALPILDLEPAEAAASMVDAASALNVSADDLVFALPVADLVATAFATGSEHWIERALRWIEEMPWIFLPVEAMRAVIDDPQTRQHIRRRIRRMILLGQDETPEVKY